MQRHLNTKIVKFYNSLKSKKREVILASYFDNKLDKTKLNIFDEKLILMTNNVIKLSETEFLLIARERKIKSKTKYQISIINLDNI